MASSAAAVYTQMASWSMAVAYRFCDGGEGRGRGRGRGRGGEGRGRGEGQGEQGEGREGEWRGKGREVRMEKVEEREGVIHSDVQTDTCAKWKLRNSNPCKQHI